MKIIKNGFLVVLLQLTILQAQHRGDNIGFQGLQPENYNGVIPVALGGAFTARSGDINALFWNSAGLSNIENISVDFEFSSVNNQWRESQRYRPNRYFVTLPFYLEGWYVPQPENNGEWDNILAQDSSYTINSQVSGNDPYSKEDADWIKKKNTSGIGHFAIAYPLDFMDRNLVLAASYSSDFNVQDFDRNDTYLSPHIGYSGYDGFTDRVDGSDTLNVDWYNYLRSRSGHTTSYSAAISTELFNNLKLGFCVDILRGETDDLLKLEKVGYFGLYDQNEFFFSYDTQDRIAEGTSEYSATKFNIGFIYNLENVDLGVNIQLPHALERKWKYSKSITDTLHTDLQTISGTDKLDFPTIFTFGANIRPTEKLSVSFDYEYAPYEDAKFKFASTDSLNPDWVNQNILRFGVQYKLFDFVSLLGGYRYTPQVFIPDGSAKDDKGPVAISYSFGTSITIIENMTVNAAYEMKELRYYDQYFSNTNYVTESVDRLLFGVNYIIR